MDRLPNANLAYVEEVKIRDYLLAHRGRGQAKAAFFEAFGFAPERWEELALALLDHGKEGALARSYETSYGVRYEVEGRLRTPSDRHPFLKTVWQEDRSASRPGPRLITAVPSYEGGERR